MTILKNMSNLLFGKNNTSQAETSQMLAARMQSSSKLDLRDSDITPLSHDPMGFDYAYYPQEVGQLGDGHYIKFHIFTNKKTSAESIVEPGSFNADSNLGTASGRIGQEFKEKYTQIMTEGGKAFEGAKTYLTENSILDIGTGDIKSFINDLNFDLEPSDEDKERYKELFTKGPRDKFDTHNERVSGAIVLYTPAQTKFKYDVDYENADTGILGNMFTGTGSFLSLTSSGAAAVAELLTSALQIVSPGISGLLGRATGMAINPNMELAFKSVPFRPFTFNFTFAPKNKKELDEVHRIIRMFKFHMLPSMTQEEQFFISPSQFEIEYMYRKNQNSYIPKISKCVLRSMEIDYDNGEKFTTLKPDSDGASPQIIKIQLQFTEMAIITKETASVGY